MRRGPYHQTAGARLPSGPRREELQCFRCADAGDVDEARARAQKRRILRRYAVGRLGRVVGSIDLCDPCAGAVTPLDPDPLTVPDSA